MSNWKEVHIKGTPVDSNVVELPSAFQEKLRSGNRWRVVVELTWDVTPDDLTEKWEGDAEVDFANRALDRVSYALDDLVGEGKPYAHYCITARTERCMD